MKVNLKRNILIICAITIILVGSIFRIVSLNRQFSGLGQEMKYGLQDIINYQGFEITLSNFTILTREEAIQKYNIDEKELLQASESEKMAIVQIRIKNVSEATQTLDMTTFSLKSGILTNDLDSYLIIALNKDKATLHPVLAPGGEFTELIGTTFSRIQVKSDDEWNSLESQDFAMVLAINPQMITIEMKN